MTVLAPERRAASATLSFTTPAGYYDGVTLTCHRATQRSADITDHQHVAEPIRSIEQHLSAALEMADAAGLSLIAALISEAHTVVIDSIAKLEH